MNQPITNKKFSKRGKEDLLKKKKEEKRQNKTKR